MDLFYNIYLCYLLVFVSSLKLTAGLSLYEKVQLLETNYDEIKGNLECKILNLETKVSTLEEKITELVEKVELQESKITAQESRITAQESQITDQESKITAQGSKITAQESKITAQGSKITAHESKITAQGSKITAQESKITTHESRITAQESQITAQETQITAQESKITAQGSKITAQGSKITAQESKITAQGSKISAHESKITAQDSLITVLKNQLENATKSVPNSVDVIDRQQVGNNPIYRTCHEINEANPSLDSGIHWIDPDGKGIGDDAISVYCNMTSGSTLIFHDLTDTKTDVGHCAERGCYSRKINYNVTSRQIASLIGLSDECHQSIKYDCIGAPLQFNGVDFSWWDDRNGDAQYFWSGSNTSKHICQCGIDRNCVESHAMCNCDSVFQKPLNDSGVITDKSILPITRLHFGRTMLSSSSGVYTLGPLECSGKVEVKRLPSSCEDLWRMGHIFSGFHTVMGDKNLDIVYCDFTKSPDQQKFQTWIGHSDVKSFPTYFFVQKNTSFNRTKIPIPFEVEQLNTGGAMDLPSGKFTAPRMGTYFFSFSGVVNFPSTLTASRAALSIGLYSKGKRIALGYVEKANSDVQFSPVTLQSTLNLKKGDQIWLQITAMSAGVHLFDSNYYYTHFTGWLLEEEIFSQ